MKRNKLLVMQRLRKTRGRILAVFFLGLMMLGMQEAAAATLVVDDDGFASASDCNALTPAFPTISAAEAVAMPWGHDQGLPGRLQRTGYGQRE